MRACLGLALAVVLGWAGLLRAEPLNLDQVAADAKWIAHLDVDAVRASTVADKAHEHWQKMHPAAVEHLEKVRDVWNFNPCEDLRGVTIYGATIKKDTGVAIVHAKVDQELLLEKARKAPQHREETYGQYQLHTWRIVKGKTHDRDMTGVFYRPDAIVFGGSVEEVKAALDVLDGSKPSLAGKRSPLAAAVPSGTMLLARVVGLAEAEGLPCKSPVCKQIDSLALAVGEKDGESFFAGRATVKSSELAQQMKAAVEGFRAMAAMGNSGDADALKIINALQVEADGTTVDVQWRAPAELVWAHLNKIGKEMKKHCKEHMSSLRGGK